MSHLDTRIRICATCSSHTDPQTLQHPPQNLPQHTLTLRHYNTHCNTGVQGLEIVQRALLPRSAPALHSVANPLVQSWLHSCIRPLSRAGVRMCHSCVYIYIQMKAFVCIRICMYVYMCMCIHRCIYENIYVTTKFRSCIGPLSRASLRLYYICVCIHSYEGSYMYVYACIYTCIYIYTYVHVFIHM